MDSLHRLEEIFAHFPGIGPRQAKRFVYYLLNKPASQVKEFIDLVSAVKSGTAECDNCHRFYIKNGSKGKICEICHDATRDHTTLMVVARDSDYESIEKSGAYRGLYFILGGSVPILDKEPEKRIRLKLLLERATKMESLAEVILSMNTTPDGEHTADIVKQSLQSILNGRATKISILGRGLSTGAELEYVDAETIRSALGNRK